MKRKTPYLIADTKSPRSKSACSPSLQLRRASMRTQLYLKRSETMSNVYMLTLTGQRGRKQQPQWRRASTSMVRTKPYKKRRHTSIKFYLKDDMTSKLSQRRYDEKGEVLGDMHASINRLPQESSRNGLHAWVIYGIQQNAN